MGRKSSNNLESLCASPVLSNFYLPNTCMVVLVLSPSFTDEAKAQRGNGLVQGYLEMVELGSTLVLFQSSGS